ncbi:MAG: hypothetical protein KAU28_05480 [Phycisphaerae bacterium]|nr:hypothetical protein [Phycisphaerae bacterium]
MENLLREVQKEAEISTMATSSEIIEHSFGYYHKQLLVELEKATLLGKLGRIYDSGQVVEIALKSLLTRLLPSHVGITRGFVFDSDCRAHSREIDLILYDKRYFAGFPIGEDGGDTLSYISIDTVLGVISVKKTLTSKELKDAVENVRSVYELHRVTHKNRFHYGLEIHGMTYRNGEEVNRIFSCVVGGTDKLFLHNLQDGSAPTQDVLSKRVKSVFKRPWFDGTELDLVYTIDGSLLSPGRWNAEAKAYDQIALIEHVGQEKMTRKGFTKEHAPNEIGLISRIFLGHPELSLGEFIVHLQIYCADLVKSTPDLGKIFKLFRKFG